LPSLFSFFLRARFADWHGGLCSVGQFSCFSPPRPLIFLLCRTYRAAEDFPTQISLKSRCRFSPLSKRRDNVSALGRVFYLVDSDPLFPAFFGISRFFLFQKSCLVSSPFPPALREATTNPCIDLPFSFGFYSAENLFFSVTALDLSQYLNKGA